MAEKPFAVLPLPFAPISASTSVPGSPPTNLAELKHMGMVWSTTGAASCFVFLDLGSVQTFDFVSTIGANADAATTIRVSAYNAPAVLPGNLVYTSGFSAFTSPAITRTDGIYSSHLEIASPVSARYVYVEISTTVNPLQIASLIIGKKLTFANYYSTGFEFGTEDLGDFELGRWGVPEETPGLIFRRWTGKFGWMSQADMDEKFRPLIERVGKRTPILFCMDPEPTVNRQARTYFGWLKEPPFFTGAANKFDRYEMEMSIISMI